MQSALWNDDGSVENSIIAQLKQQVAKVITACWYQWEIAVRAFPQDAWRDEELPIRVLESLDLLVFRSDPVVKLTPAEIVLVLTTPFVREAVLACSIAKMTGANPLSLDEVSPDNDLRSALDKVHQSEPRLLRRASRLKEQGQDVDKNAVMTWLLHSCLLRSLEIWRPQSEGGYLADDFVKALDNISRCQPRLIQETLSRKRLLELARCMFAGLERIERDDRPDALQSRLIVGRYWEEQPIREKMVAYLLKLAGLLAMDIRTLSDVLVDHIGLADTLTPEQISHIVNQARWNPSGRGRTLILYHSMS